MESRLRVILVEEVSEKSVLLAQALEDADCRLAARVAASKDLVSSIERLKPDAVIIDFAFPDWNVLTRLCRISRDQRCPIIVFTQDEDGEKIRAAIEAGVSAYIVRGLSRERIKPILDVAVARFKQNQTLRKELDQLRSTLIERKIIERAKGILMQQRGCSEQEAYHTLRKTAMDRNRRMVEIAQNIIDVGNLFN